MSENRGVDPKRRESTRPVLSLSEVARQYALAPWTVRAAIDRGDLPAYRLPGQRRLRILREDVVQWLRSNPAGSDRRC